MPILTHTTRSSSRLFRSPTFSLPAIDCSSTWCTVESRGYRLQHVCVSFHITSHSIRHIRIWNYHWWWIFCSQYVISIFIVSGYNNCQPQMWEIFIILLIFIGVFNIYISELSYLKWNEISYRVKDISSIYFWF